MVTLRQLRYLEALAETLHFGQAAEACAVTQPALSMQIKELEDELQVSLIERRKSGFELTEQGEEIVRRGRVILASVRDLLDYAKHRERVLTGSLKLGAIPSIAPYLLPDALPELQRRFPDLTLHLREEEVLESIRRCREQFGDGVERVFLADGDAMTLSTRRLVTVLEAIHRDLPGVRRVSSYCLPRNLRKKSAAELRELAGLGLSLVYVGAESGDDEVLSRVNKGETFATTREALEKLQEAGIKRSVMILNGLGGRALSQQHALNSAALMNVAQPEYLATLVVSFPKGKSRLRGNFPSWEPLCWV